VNSIVLIDVLVEMFTDVGAPLLVNVAVLSGAVGLELSSCPWSTRSRDLAGAVDRTRGLRGKRGERAETGRWHKDESARVCE